MPAPTGPRPVPPLVRVTTLASAGDWQRAARRLASLEAAGAPEAWAAPAWQEAVWRLQGQSPTWLVEIGADAARPDAALFLRQGERRTPVGRVRVLRSADWHAMRMAPWLVRPGREQDSARSLLAAAPLLGRATGAHLLRLFKLDAAATAPLQAALEEARHPYRLLPMEPSPVVRLPERFPDWLAGHRHKTLYNLRRSRRLLGGALGGELRLRRFRPTGDPAADPDPELRRAWQAVRALQLRKWQAIVRAESGAVPAGARPQDVLAFADTVAAAWGRRGWLEILLLQGGGQPVAAQVQLVHPERTWVVWMAYDKAFARYSPGRVLLLEALELVHRDGVRLVELGASGEHWKRQWCNGAEPVLRLEWSLGGWKGTLWGLGARFRGLRRPGSGEAA